MFLLLLVILACSDETLFREPSEEPGEGKKELGNHYIHQNWGWHGYCNGYYYHVDPNARKKMDIKFTFDQNRMYIPIEK